MSALLNSVLLESEVNSLNSNPVIAKLPTMGKNKSIHSNNTSSYRPITEKDLDLELLSIIPLPQHERPLKRSLYLAAPLIILLPILYLFIIIASIAMLSWHAQENIIFLTQKNTFLYESLYALLYFSPIIIGIFVIFILAKPLFSNAENHFNSSIIVNKNNSLFLSYINKIADKIGAPNPIQVRLTLEPIIELSVIDGFTGLHKNQFRLSIGLPIIAQVNSQQLTSLITREFAFYGGHTSKRAIWVIRSIRRWFYRASTQPDSFDILLKNLKKTHKAKLSQWLLTEAQSIANLTQKTLNVFSRLANWIARPLLHKLYFRADDINNAFCGIDAVRKGEAHLHFLECGFERFQKTLKSLDVASDKDLVRTIVNHAKDVANEQNKLAGDPRTRTTPNDVDVPRWNSRIKRLESSDTSVLYQQKYPAKCLLPNFQALSLNITTDFYNTRYSITSCPTDLNPGALNGNPPPCKTEKTLMVDYFNHLFRHDNVLTPNWLQEGYESSLTIKRDLQIAICQLRQAIPDWKKTIESLDYINRSIKEKQLSEEKAIPKSNEKQQLMLEIENLEQTQRGLWVERSTMDNILNRRLSLGISYYVSLINKEKRNHFSEAMTILSMLKEIQPHLQSLSTNGHLLEQQLRIPEEKMDLRLNAQLKTRSVNCRKSISSIQETLDAYSQNELLDPLTASIKELKSKSRKQDPITLLNSSRSTLEAFRDLYANVITEIVQACTLSERKLNVAPLKVAQAKSTV
ncbi:MAG: hypothetical protein JKY67_13775 [Pseudomonadales bacterium]|nr:hypothetical protein [Pseudomonadales bacterium]